MMRLLMTGHADLIIAVDEVAYLTINREFTGQGIHRVGDVLHEEALYHFLNRRNRKPIGRLDAAIRAMAENGEIREIRKRALDALFRPIEPSC